MLRTELPAVPNYGRSNDLIKELVLFTTHGEQHERDDFAAWLLDAYTLIASKLPGGGGM